jgi:hypothetical protein
MPIAGQVLKLDLGCLGKVRLKIRGAEAYSVTTLANISRVSNLVNEPYFVNTKVALSNTLFDFTDSGRLGDPNILLRELEYLFFDQFEMVSQEYPGIRALQLNPEVIVLVLLKNSDYKAKSGDRPSLGIYSDVFDCVFSALPSSDPRSFFSEEEARNPSFRSASTSDYLTSFAMVGSAIRRIQTFINEDLAATLADMYIKNSPLVIKNPKLMEIVKDYERRNKASVL